MGAKPQGTPPKRFRECTPRGEGHEAGAVGKRKKGQERRRKRRERRGQIQRRKQCCCLSRTHSLTRSVTEHFPKQLMS